MENGIIGGEPRLSAPRGAVKEDEEILLHSETILPTTGGTSGEQRESVGRGIVP
jgi:hypothetical protein